MNKVKSSSGADDDDVYVLGQLALGIGLVQYGTVQYSTV